MFSEEIQGTQPLNPVSSIVSTEAFWALAEGGMRVGDGQMLMIVLFLKYFTCGDKMMPFYWARGSDLYTSCLERPEGELRHSGNKAWSPNVLCSSPPLLP